MTVALQVLAPASVVDCLHYACKLSARVCVLRQRKAIHSLYGKPMNESTQALSSFCRTGKCEQGKDVAAQLGTQVLEPVRKPSCFLPRLKLVSPAPKKRERRRIAPLSTLPPAAIDDVGEDLDVACAPPPDPELEQRREEIAAAVLAQREEPAVRPPPRGVAQKCRPASATSAPAEHRGRRDHRGRHRGDYQRLQTRTVRTFGTEVSP